MLAAQGQGIRTLYSEVDGLLRLYLMVPVSNATAERRFSGLRRLKTSLWSTMSKQLLNHLLFLHIHRVDRQPGPQQSTPQLLLC